MSTGDLLPFFEERFGEVDAYLELLDQVETATQSGVPRIAGSNYPISADQQKILYSSVYLQLYNLVEATMARCVAAITDAAAAAGQWQPHDLNEYLHQEWVRAVAGTHIELSPVNRLKYALRMSDHIVNKLPVSTFAIDTGGGGNWDDESIHEMAKRLGCQISLSKPTQEGVKRQKRDGLGPLKLVKNRRNSLAHGSISFVDCADGVAVSELRETAENIEKYLREVIDNFKQYIDSFDFLRPISRPNGATT
ncbi:MAE_28990/MAE_18760 family HEPN-like nuclease [Streptomyces sp. NPDC087422]|uniref:MAE_28990/MAE_18760 family HEPN-like nuclease n=1 Tax=Streptomyces sp. NPDC087422 TaxID=3365786 RepID=UPI00382DB820